MATAPRTVYRCRTCGHEAPKWLGRCPDCGEWNTLDPVEPPRLRAKTSGSIAKALGSGGGRRPGTGVGGSSGASTPAVAVALADIGDSADTRIATGIGELDRVLGGGVMAGASVLVGGEPGIGKSTLLLQAAAAVAGSSNTGPPNKHSPAGTRPECTVLYVSGEESLGQIKSRCKRLGIDGVNITLLCESDLEAILTVLSNMRPQFVVIDSIQTITIADSNFSHGSINQIRFAVHEIADWARTSGAACFFVAHVTKEGSIAGPKTVEHMVDAVLYFEQSGGEIRFLRTTKNRFGSTDEIGLFLMDETGLRPVGDASRLFLVNRQRGLPAGVVPAPVYEGSRILMVEIQALTVPAKGGVSRTFSERIDQSRVSRIAAVLERHLSLRFSDQDVYVNVAGGIRISEVGVDLPIAVALFSARTGVAVRAALTVTGEVSLSGELHSVPHLRRRAQTATELGFDECVGPAAICETPAPAGARLIGVTTIKAAIEAVFADSPATSAARRPAVTGTATEWQ